MRAPPLFLALFLGFLRPDLSQAEEIEFVHTNALWGALSLRSLTEGPFNPGNRVLQLPQEVESLEARPDWRIVAPRWSLTARPRGVVSRERVKTSLGSSSRVIAKQRWSEAFGTWNATDSVSLDYGLQNFQWGPAESASPSNRIVRDTIQVKDALYLVRGKHLVRLSWVPSPEWSEILLVEPTGNGEGEPEPNEPHRVKVALKSEISWSGGRHFAGLVAGWRDHAGGWIGEYVNLELVDGLFAYGDLSHQKGSLAYYPTYDPSGRFTIFSQNRRHDGILDTFSVIGLRYAFENGNDIRLEWIHQDAGYSKFQLEQAKAAFSSTNPLQLAALAPHLAGALQPGLDFPATHYLFSSARFPDSFGIRNWNLYARVLHSLQDASTSFFASSENAIGEHGTLIGSLGLTQGQLTDELKGAVDLAALLAYRHAW
ncbi:MAG TPA: hypothetical protein VIH99_04540 [Bdellovibrionota bacterium]|jgi:hypothetical protein